MRRLKWAVMLGAMGAMALAAQAQGATTIGETFVPTEPCGDEITLTGLQTGSPSNQYVVPTPGVITAWSFQAPAVVNNSIKLKVARPAGESVFTIIGSSGAKVPTPNVLNTYTDVRVPVLPGDVIGLTVLEGTDSTNCLRTGLVPGFTWHRYLQTDPGVGLTDTFGARTDNLQFDISARLEADADRDGFGDETQDACPTDATTQGPCRDSDAPETTITKDAPKRLDADKVKFRFASDEVGSTFECKLKGKDLKRRLRQFNDCTSPRKYKNLDEGRFKFKVRAIDAAGNVDLTPDKDRFKVVD